MALSRDVNDQYWLHGGPMVSQIGRLVIAKLQMPLSLSEQILWYRQKVDGFEPGYRQYI